MAFSWAASLSCFSASCFLSASYCALVAELCANPALAITDKKMVSKTCFKKFMAQICSANEIPNVQERTQLAHDLIVSSSPK